MTVYLYGHPIDGALQNALGVEPTGEYDDATREAVAALFGKSGKKIDFKEASHLLEGVHEDDNRSDEQEQVDVSEGPSVEDSSEMDSEEEVEEE